MVSISAWIVSFRLRTLPLSLSTIILGSLLAAYYGEFNWNIFILAIITTLFLQILSNLANEYGDAIHGVDHHGRIGPKRSVQVGHVSLKQMKMAVITFVILSFLSGTFLIILASDGLKFSYSVLLFIIGMLAIGAALKYTIGKNPYGYASLGDLAVFIFFGLVGVLGTFFLHTHALPITIFLPAISIGLFSAGVLNLNNLRDRENDAANGKNTLVVKLGSKRAKVYHTIILSVGMMSALGYSFLIEVPTWHWIYLLTFPLFIRSCMVVFNNEHPSLLDPELRALALSTLSFSILFGVGLII